MNDLEKPRIGLLPLMLELYRDLVPELADKQKPFIASISDKFRNFSEVVEAPVCVNRNEVKLAIKDFEMKDVDLIVIVFIAYATSISALNALLETQLPLLLFSTAPRNSMAEGMTGEDITLNHGVHGYMDLANVLKRNKRYFQFVSGKKDDKKAINEIERWAKIAKARKMLKKSTIGIAGYTFDGMGDFGIDTTLLNTVFGPEVRHVPLNLLADSIMNVSKEDIEKEIKNENEKYIIGKNIDINVHQESNRVYLGLLKVVEELSLNAFTMHFMGILENPHIKTPPFLAISKLQEKGLAYAGEGDLLGALANLIVKYVCDSVIFTEPFCPDFDGGRIVMGHMGESNPAFGKETVLRRKKFPFGKVVDPVVADVHMNEGRATVLNLAVMEESEFQMIIYTGEICEKIPGANDIDMPYFHFKPDLKLSDFLTNYGFEGGTHHLALTKGDRREDIMKLAEILNINVVLLG